MQATPGSLSADYKAPGGKLLRVRLTLDTDLVQLNLEISLAKELRQGLLVDLWPRLAPSIARNVSLHSKWGITRLAGRTQSPAAERFIACVEAACSQN